VTRPLSLGRAVALLAFAAVSAAGAAARPAPPDDAPSRTAALAFVRVVADLRIEFGGVREPIVRRGVELATGSGFVVSPGGLVITSEHVVAETEPKTRYREEEADVTVENRRIEVVVEDGGRVLEAWVAAADAGIDLAALQVTAADLPYLPMGDSDAAEPGGGVTVLGFPFGRQVEVAREGALPRATVTAGSLSAAREGEGGDRRFLQTDASVNPGSSGGPMLDADGYVVGVVRMKLSPGATKPGAGFAVPVNLVKDFLEATGLAPQLPSGRLRPGVLHTHDWKGVRLEMPDGFRDVSPSRTRLEAGEVEGIDARAWRLATPLEAEAVQDALLRGRAIAGFAPAAATPRAGVGPERRRGAPRVLGSAAGETPDGRRFRVEYALVERRGEMVVARYLGHPDAIAYNLGLVRGSLRSLAADPIRAAGVALDPPAFEQVPLPAGGAVPMPAGWPTEPATASACGALSPASEGLAASPPSDFTIVLRALRWPAEATTALAEAVASCGSSEATAAATRGVYRGRVDRLGVPLSVQGALVPQGDGVLLLELEVPLSRLPAVEGLWGRWVASAGGIL
jgi:S1-C subfamily serine protease